MTRFTRLSMLPTVGRLRRSESHHFKILRRRYAEYRALSVVTYGQGFGHELAWWRSMRRMLSW